tara:strand:- start:806 stop:1012 length:207 start_codon:yes stop_codon:yes gene_type:complete
MQNDSSMGKIQGMNSCHGSSGELADRGASTPKTAGKASGTEGSQVTTVHSQKVLGGGSNGKDPSRAGY